MKGYKLVCKSYGDTRWCVNCKYQAEADSQRFRLTMVECELPEILDSSYYFIDGENTFYDFGDKSIEEFRISMSEMHEEYGDISDLEGNILQSGPDKNGIEIRIYTKWN